MFFIIYILFRLLCFILIKNSISAEMKKSHIFIAYVTIFLPVLFYIAFPYGGIILLAEVTYSLLIYIIVLFAIRNKMIKFLSIINLIEFITIVIPTTWKFISGPLFTPSKYTIYFLYWKIFE